MAKKNTKILKFEALDKELQNLLYSRDNSKLISVLKEEKNPLHLEQLAQLDVKSCKNLGFPVLWSLYENDFIPFEENFLLEKLCDALFLMNKYKEIESFILKRPVIAEKLCTKLPFFLTDNFSTNTFLYDNLLILAEKGYFKNTQVLANLLEVLLSPLKTSTANSYCRLIEDFNPTTEELLPSQQTLFALLSSDKTSVVNFVMKLIKQIAEEKDFHFQSFADNFALCFATPKIANVDRLFAYQTAGKEVDLDDLVVACNRLLLSTITPEAQEKVRSLSGQYAPALGYFFGLSDVVTPTEEFLPLWTQITRLKHPNKVFTEFETTAAKDYLSAVKPFFPSYEIEGEFKQFFLEKVYVDDYYNYTLASPFDSSVFDRLPYNCYNAGAYDRWDTDTLRYVISLNPQYVDVLLGKYTPLYVGDSDAETQRNLREPLQLLLEYDLPVHHGGWIFVGMALLHDKKETRDLAAEYILRAISRDEDLSYLQHFLADILAQKLTPINRFVEFLDMPTRDPKIKAFQKAVVEAYLPLAEKQEKKPTNHKKLANWLM